MWLTLLFTLTLIALSAFGVCAPPAAAWTLLGSVLLAVIGWAAGPRMAQYLFPQIGAVAAALSKSDARWPNRFKDDERGAAS